MKDFPPVSSELLARVKPLASKNAAGDSYKRPPYVDNAIAHVHATPESERKDLLPDLPPEAVVYSATKLPCSDPVLQGRVIQEVSMRTTGIVWRCTRGLDKLAAEEVLMKVELRILDLVLTKKESRARDFLEIAFASHVEARAYNAIRDHLVSPFGECREYLDGRHDDDGQEIEHVFDTLPTADPGPHEILLRFRDRNERHRLLRKACQAVPDRQLLKALIFHFGYNWPVISKDRQKPSIVRHFGISERKADRWLAGGMQIMRDALADEIREKQQEQEKKRKRDAKGGQ